MASVLSYEEAAAYLRSIGLDLAATELVITLGAKYPGGRVMWGHTAFEPPGPDPYGRPWILVDHPALPKMVDQYFDWRGAGWEQNL